MAVRASEELLGEVSIRDPLRWVAVSHDTIVATRAETVRRLLFDIPAWSVWRPGVVSVTTLEGGRSEPGAIYRIEFGTPSYRVELVELVAARSSDRIVLAGGNRRWRNIEVLSVEAMGDRTRIGHRLDLRIPRGWGWTGAGVRRLLTDHLKRTGEALS